MGILEKNSSPIFQSLVEIEAGPPRRVLLELWIPSQIRDSLAQWSSAPTVSSATSQTASHLWPSSDLGAQCHLGSRWLSLVRASEGPAASPYKKDDNAHIEQKNWTHVRRLLGYERYDSPTALEALNDLYSQELRLFQN